MSDLRELSLWWDQLDEGDLHVRDPLDGDTQADVVVVGAGLTGLWTAYYLLEADPALDVLVVEQQTAGFGASGRAGGWCSARFPVPAQTLTRTHGAPAAQALRAALRDAVVEVGGAAAAELVDCDFAYGGSVTLARNGPQLDRVRAQVSADTPWGDETVLLDADGVGAHVRAQGVLGGSFTPDCARVQPARLVRGLVDVVLSRGARLVEGTRALRISPRAVVTDHGTVRTRYVVRATQAWSSALPDPAHATAPARWSMIATEPLSAATWAEIGLDAAQTFTDARHVPVHGQRSADGRLVLGGPDRRPADAERLRRTMVALFPVLHGTAVTHTWGGPVAVPRDGHPSVGLDDDGIAWAGGFAGDGIAAGNLAGRTLADLLTGTDSPLVRLPWVGHRSPDWQPDPLRRAGLSAVRHLATRADRAEDRTDRPSRLLPLLDALPGERPRA